MTGRYFKTSEQPMEKVLLIGLAESGKSTIVRVAFEGNPPPPKDAQYFATLEYERTTIEVEGEKLSIFDVGGQKAFLDRFTGDLAGFIFNNVRVFIFVVDLPKLDELQRAKFYFDKCMHNLEQYSPNARIAIFLHKTDLIEGEVEYYEYAIQSALMTNISLPISIYLTSVYDDSIYNAVKSVLSSVERSTEALEPLIVSFHAKTSAKSVEVISMERGPLTQVGDVKIQSEVSEKLGPRLIDFLTAEASREPHDKITGVVVETELGMLIWRKIDEDLLLTATFPKSSPLLEIYPSVNSLISRLGSTTKSKE